MAQELPTRTVIEYQPKLGTMTEQAKEALTNSRDLTPLKADLLRSIIDMFENKAEGQIWFELPELLPYLAQYDKKPPTVKKIRNRLKTLIDIGFVSSNQLPTRPESGGHPPVRYLIHDFLDKTFQSRYEAELAQALQGRSSDRATHTKNILSHLQRSNAQFAETLPEDGRPLTEMVYAGLLDCAQRISSREVVEGNRIYTTTTIRKTVIEIEATTFTGATSELTVLRDQQLIRSITTIVARTIERLIRQKQGRGFSLFENDSSADISFNEKGDPYFERPAAQIDTDMPNIPNSFYLDVVQLARLMGYASPSSSSVRYYINKSLRRLYETNYRVAIKSGPPGEIDRVMRILGMDDRVGDFRFLTTLQSQYDTQFYSDKSFTESTSGSQLALMSDGLEERSIDPYSEVELKRVRLWKISIDPELFKRLQDPDNRPLYAAHEEIMRESDGLGQRLYNVAVRTIGRSNQEIRGKKERSIDKDLDDMHDLLWPYRRYDRFKSNLIALLKRHAGDNGWDDSLVSNRIPMYGYIFHLYCNEDQRLRLNIKRNRHDELAGDNSFFNHQLEKAVRFNEEDSGSDHF